MLPEYRYAEVAIRLLLGQADSQLLLDPLSNDVNWNIFLSLTQKNRVPIRLYESFVKLGFQPGEVYQNFVNAERARIKNMVVLMGELNKMLDKSGIDFVYMKNYQHYPDMGEDIDLFVNTRTKKVDSIFINTLKAKPHKRTLLNKIGGKTQYTLDGWPFEIEIHHGRMGSMGEHIIFTKYLVANRRNANIDGVELWVPSPEDQFIVQVLQRVYGRFYFRISELVYVINAVLMERFDWDYIVKIAKLMGIFDGLQLYLSNVELIYQNIMNKSLPCINSVFPAPRRIPAKIKFSDSHYRIPLQTVVTTLYIKKLFLDIKALRYFVVVRTLLLPFFTILVIFKNVIRNVSKTLALNVL